MSNYVPVAFLYVDDGWYGKRYRYILQPAEGEYYGTKTEAKKMVGKLKKHMKALSQQSGFNQVSMDRVSVDVEDHDTLKEYEHHSFGPSISHKHIYITPDALLHPKTKAQIEEEYRWYSR